MNINSKLDEAKIKFEEMSYFDFFKEYNYILKVKKGIYTSVLTPRPIIRVAFTLNERTFLEIYLNKI